MCVVILIYQIDLIIARGQPVEQGDQATMGIPNLYMNSLR